MSTRDSDSPSKPVCTSILLTKVTLYPDHKRPRTHAAITIPMTAEKLKGAVQPYCVSAMTEMSVFISMYNKLILIIKGENICI